MKHLFTCILLIAVGAVSCNNQNADKQVAASTQETLLPHPGNKEPANLTTITWTDSVKQVGKITEGQKLKISFKFKNTGDKPLIIQAVNSSCGCTVADKPEKPIAPGQEGEIKGEFDSNGRVGILHKNIMVTANTSGSSYHTLTFEGEVVPMKK